jgi:hypothetical protein
MKLTREQLLGIIRHALTFAGGILIAKGLVDETIVTDIVGLSMTLAGAIWSVSAKNA